MQNHYICPMHPEVTSTSPTTCARCGMALVTQEPPSSSISPQHHSTKTANSYQPLLIILFLLMMSALVASWKDGFALESLIASFMTGFFLVFSGFKLIDLHGFAKGYAKYDLIAQRVYAYGYVYPFIELAFGLSMLAGYHPDWLLWTEVGVMVVSGLGVTQKILKEESFTCACLGTFLKVPLTHVTLVEDFGMALLAIVLIAMR